MAWWHRLMMRLYHKSLIELNEWVSHHSNWLSYEERKALRDHRDVIEMKIYDHLSKYICKVQRLDRRS